MNVREFFDLGLKMFASSPIVELCVYVDAMKGILSLVS